MYRYTTRYVRCYLWLQEKIHWKCTVNLYLNLPIDSAGHCTRYVNIKVFSEPYFSTYGQNPRTYTGKYVPEKTLIVLYFTKCDVFH